MVGPEVMFFEKKGRYEENGNADPKKCPRHKNILLIIVALLGLEFVNIALWQLGTIPTCPSIFVSEILTGVMAFLAGRIYEKLNK